MKKLLLILSICILLCACGKKEEPPVVLDFSTEYFGDVDPQGLQVQHGEVQSILQNGDIVIITCKVRENLTNDMIVKQNYYNVEKLVTKNGFNTCNMLKYMAVMDIDGEEIKVVSFDLNKETIDKIYNEQIFGSQIADYTENLWINSGLQ